MSVPYTITSSTEEGERAFATAILPSGSVTLSDDNPAYEEFVDALLAGVDAEEVERLADASRIVAEKFRGLSERVSVGAGRVFFDGDEVDDSVARHLLRVLDEKREDWRPLVSFMEKIATNPNEHSREQLYDWLRAREFTITDEGDIVGYKGVQSDGEGGYRSLHSGSAIRNGEAVTGQVPNAVGDTIEMPRAKVAHDPGAACSYGLHVGTYEYAHAYASGAMLKVAVNPRDVVSVPTDAGGEKVRVARYRVLATIDAPETAAVVEADPFDLSDDRYEQYCPECDDYLDSSGYCESCEEYV